MRPPNASSGRRDGGGRAVGRGEVGGDDDRIVGSLAAVASSWSAERATRATRAPAASSAAAIAAPIPRPAPVTMAVRPSSARTVQSDPSVIVTELMTTSWRGRSLRVGLDALHLLEDVETLHDLAEQAVLRRQADAARAGDEEELAAVGVRTGVGHGDRADLVLAGLGQLVGELVAGAATAGAGRVAALAHEAVDDAVEDDAVVVVVGGEEDEVVDGVRRLDGVEGDDDLAERGVERRRVALLSGRCPARAATSNCCRRGADPSSGGNASAIDAAP